jgi:hypothetical protein
LHDDPIDALGVGREAPDVPMGPVLRHQVDRDGEGIGLNGRHPAASAQLDQDVGVVAAARRLPVARAGHGRPW